MKKIGDTRPNYTADLRATIKATSASITPQKKQRPIASMLSCIDAISHAKGAQSNI